MKMTAMLNIPKSLNLSKHWDFPIRQKGRNFLIFICFFLLVWDLFTNEFNEFFSDDDDYDGLCLMIGS